MSAYQIMTELENLSLSELKFVEERAAALAKKRMEGEPPAENWKDAIAPLIGTAVELPADMALNHDHYIYGTPKR